MKRTDKYIKAKKIAATLKLNITETLGSLENKKMYRILNERSYYWNSKAKEWEEMTFEGAGPPF